MKTPLPFPPFEGDKPFSKTENFDSDQAFAKGGNEEAKRHKFIPFRFLLPNFITTMAIVSGLSSIRSALDGNFKLSVLLLLIAAFLDAIDGRIARATRGTSRFGEQLDSLADAINFGAAPALVIYVYILQDMGKLGWLAALIYSIACCLRLARFNVMIDDKHKRPKWQQNYFTGVPSPGGCILLLLPVYLGFLGMPVNKATQLFFCIYTIIIALLMVCNLPIWNGKSIRAGLRRDIVVPALLLAVIYLVLLISYMWYTLAVTAIGYLLFLPLSCFIYCRRARLDAGESE